MDGRRRRRGCGGGGPVPSLDDPEGIAGNRSAILDTIHGYYKQALDALPLVDMPELAPRLLAAGVCFGFADPVTNIIANTLCFLPPDDDKDGGEPEPDSADKTRKRRRKMVTTKASSTPTSREDLLSGIVAGGGGNLLSPPPAEERTIAERSLEGLITFLTIYFRYLQTWDALRYLRRAKADLLVAIRLIELDRCYHNKKNKDESFHICSYTAKTAIKCAALSSGQPNVDDVLTGSFSLSLASHLQFITQTVGAAAEDHSCPLSVKKICLLSGMLLKKPLMPDKSENHTMLLLASDERFRNSHKDDETVPGWLAISLRDVLLDRIHVHYLKAISLLPMQDVRARYHRGLVNAGYCYGPFDSVTNIIVNTIWYDHTFPALEKLEVDMICTSTFVRVESRSLCGLIKLLLTCIPEISENEAIIYLLKNNLKVQKAIKMARMEGYESKWDTSAYKAAADASFHPELEAYVEFATQSLPLVRCAVKSLLRASYSLSSSEVFRLSKILSPNSNLAKPLEAIDELSKDALEMFTEFKEKFINQQSFFRRKIEAALKNKGYFYELQVICVANERVGRQKGFLDFKCPYSHVNFLASPKVGSGLKLFFAEFSNDDNDDQSFAVLCQTNQNTFVVATVSPKELGLCIRLRTTMVATRSLRKWLVASMVFPMQRSSVVESW